MQSSNTTLLTLHDLTAAQHRLRGTILRTPCEESLALSRLTGCRIFLKKEYLQRTGSFKERGARNALALLTPGEVGRGVIAASAGNHALGLAWHGRELGIPVTVVMPRTAPEIKVQRCRDWGATVVLAGETFEAAREVAVRLTRKGSLAYIHPFDDLRVIAGQGTLGLEIVEQVPEADAVLIPVGGGGLLAGMATALRAARGDVEIIGVEPTSAACFCVGLTTGFSRKILSGPTLADGLAVSQAGANTLAIAGPLVNAMEQVSEVEIAHALQVLATVEGCVVEGAGAVGLAALWSGRLSHLQGKTVVLPLTGRNIDRQMHRQIVGARHEMQAIAA